MTISAVFWSRCGFTAPSAARSAAQSCTRRVQRWTARTAQWNMPKGKAFCRQRRAKGWRGGKSFFPVNVSTALRREAIAALERINADSFTLDAINSTLSGCGIKALAEETEKKGTVKVWFPNTVGVPEEFSQVESIILDIIPCHLLVEFYFRYLTWLECEAQGFTWRIVEDEKHHTWESFERAVPAES